MDNDRKSKIKSNLGLNPQPLPESSDSGRLDEVTEHLRWLEGAGDAVALCQIAAAAAAAAARVAYRK